MSVINFLGLPTNISSGDREFLKHKCEAAVPILKDNWTILLPKSRDFLNLVDKQKIAFSIGVKKLNSIFDSGFFTAEEEKLIKRLRYQGRNNLAARNMRDKYRSRDEDSEREIRELIQEKENLIEEKRRLTLTILNYKKALESVL